MNTKCAALSRIRFSVRRLPYGRQRTAGSGRIAGWTTTRATAIRRPATLQDNGDERRSIGLSTNVPDDTGRSPIARASAATDGGHAGSESESAYFGAVVRPKPTLWRRGNGRAGG